MHAKVSLQIRIVLVVCRYVTFHSRGEFVFCPGSIIFSLFCSLFSKESVVSKDMSQFTKFVQDYFGFCFNIRLLICVNPPL